LLLKAQELKTSRLYAHSSLALNAQTEQIIGLENQYYFYRNKEVPDTRDELAYWIDKLRVQGGAWA
jgi:hypothetical protein